MKKIYSLFLLLGLLAFGANTWAQCDNGSCSITISGTDAYGDGWNGASITITQNGSTVGTFTVSGSSTQQTYSCCQGPVSFSWTTGSYDSECSFTITDSVGTQLYSATTGPSAGTFCTATACPSCYGPSTITVSNITPDSATVTWSANDVAAGWLYQITPSATPIDTWTSTTDTTVVFDSLNANTVYYFHIFAACATDSGDVHTTSFRTGCGNQSLPFSEGFEDNGSNMPSCWTLYEHVTYTSYGYTYNYPQIYSYSYYAHSGTYSLYLYPYYGPNSILSPRILIPANQVEVLLWAKTSYSVGSLEVGYTTTSDSANAVFHSVQELTVDGTYALYNVSFANVSTTDSIYVCFRTGSGTTGVYVDDVTIRQANTCPLADSLTLVSSASHQVTLNWRDTVATSWEISYGEVGFDPDYSTVRVAANTKPFTVTGLSDSITYEFYVRSVCGTQRGYWCPASVVARPNVFDMPMSGTDTVYLCGGAIANPGGVASDFPTYTTSYMVVYPSDSTMTVSITGSANLTTYGYSHLYFYEGVGTSGRLLGDYNMPTSNINVTSDVGPITIYLSASYYSGSYLLQTSCSPLPTCTDVYNLDITGVSGNSAVVNWDYATVTTPSEFSIEVIDTASNNIMTFTAPDTARSLVVTGLSQRTDYLVRVMSNCTNGDTSDWVTTLFQTHCLSGGDIQVGEGTNTNYRIPFNAIYTSVVQQIFDSIELTQVDTLFGIKYFNTSSNSQTRNFDIYIDTTSQASYSDRTDYIPQAPAKMVFSGDFDIVSGWNEIRFDSTFAYNGRKNLVVTFCNHNNGTGSSVYSQTHATEETKTIWGYVYSSNTLDPSDSNCFATLASYYTGIIAERNNFVFVTTCGDASCVPPSARVTGATDSSVLLAWTPGLYETEWSVEFKPTDSTNWDFFHITTNIDSAIVSGLIPATEYDFRISSLCGDTTASTIVHAKTHCSAFDAFPLVEDFEHFVGDNYNEDFQSCWNRWDNYTSSYSTYYYPYIYSYYQRSGSYSMYMGGSSNYFNSMLILPEVASRLDTLTLSFYMMGTYTSSYRAEIGALTDPSNVNGFELIDTVRFTLSSYEWELKEIDLASYTGTGRYIAIRVPEDGNSFFIDDLKLDYTNPCKRPLQASVMNTTTNSATLTFSDTNYTGNYTIIYGTSENLTDATDTVTTTSTSVTINGLATSTQYYAWVRANCSLIGCSSDWTEFGAFRTKCDAIIVDNDNPYEINFEFGMDSCMTQSRISGSTDWEATTSTSNPTGAYSGGHVASLTSSREDITMLMLPTFDFTSLPTGAELSFWQAQVEYTYYSSNSELYLYYRTSATGDWTLIDSMVNPIAHWTEYSTILPNSAYAPFYEVAFKGVVNQGYGTKLDDISVHATPTCQRPTNLLVNSVTENTADLSWNGDAPSYQVRYRKIGSLSWSNATAATNSITLTDLTPLSNYEFRIKGICGFGSQSNLSAIGYFSTNACAEPDLFFSYDSVAVDTVSTVAPLNPYYGYSYTETIIDAVKLTGLTDITGIAFNVANAQYGSYFDNCRVYLGMTTDTALSNFLFDTNFVEVYNGSLAFSNTGWKPFLLSAPYAYDGTSNLVVGVYRAGGTSAYNNCKFYAHQYNCNKSVSMYNSGAFTPAQASGYGSYMRPTSAIAPDFQFISCAPVCDVPEIDTLYADEYTATLSWTAANDEAQVSFKAQNETEWSAPVNVVGSHYTFTGLNHSTQYAFRVRQDCTYDSIGYSEWVGATISTAYVCAEVSNVQVDVLNNSHATVSWTSAPSDTRWEINVTGNEFNRTYVATSNPFTIDGLDQNSTYTAAVRVLCGPDYNVYGEYSSSVQFTTPICGAIGFVNAEAIGNIVHLWWAPTSNNSGYYEVQWGRSGYNASEVLGSIITPDTEAYVYNLGAHFTYGFRVRSICGLAWTSGWSSPEVTVTTGDITGIDDVDQQFRCAIYPNPATSSTTISVSGVEGHVAIEVVDMNGRIVATDTFECAADCEKRMDVSGLAQGTYFVRVATATSNSVRKLIVK